MPKIKGDSQHEPRKLKGNLLFHFSRVSTAPCIFRLVHGRRRRHTIRIDNKKRNTHTHTHRETSETLWKCVIPGRLAILAILHDVCVFAIAISFPLSVAVIVFVGRPPHARGNQYLSSPLGCVYKAYSIQIYIIYNSQTKMQPPFSLLSRCSFLFFKRLPDCCHQFDYKWVGTRPGVNERTKNAMLVFETYYLGGL